MKINVFDTPSVETVIDIDRFSKLNKLHRETVNVLRFIHSLKAGNNWNLRRQGHLSKEEML